MKKLLIVILVMSLLILVAASSVRFEKDTGNIQIDASKPYQIVWPCQVDIVGEDGEEGFKIGPDVDQGWRNRKWDTQEDTEATKGDGYAIYNFYVPSDGDYTLWGYALWDDPCTNAVFVKIDQGIDTILGNNPVYKKWHWIRGTSTYLTKGSHTLTLSNHSNNIALQKLMFIGSKYKAPLDCDNYFTDIFYDDFDGCDLGNFHQWNKLSGKWHVDTYDKSTCTNNNSLIGESAAGSNCKIEVSGNQWENYCFDIDISLKKWAENASAIVRFGENTERDYFAVKLIPVSLSQFKLQLLKREGAEDVVLKEIETAKEDFSISLNKEEEIVLVLDGKEVIRTENQSYRGGISLLLEGEIVASFDNLHVRYLESAK